MDHDVGQLAQVFKALSDETRLTILAMLLRRGELCVCDVEGVLRISQSKASRHLRYLRNAGLIEDRRDGLWVHYRISEKPGSAAHEVMSLVGDLLESLDGDALDRQLEAWMKHKADGAVCGPPNTTLPTRRIE